MFTWLGSLVSDFGDRFTEFGLAWYMLERTGNPLDLALTFLLFQLPSLFSGLIVGWLLDRFPKESIMLTDNVTRGGLVFLVPLLEYTHVLSLPLLWLIVVLLGMLSVATHVGNKTLMTEFVAPSDYNTANALNVARTQFSAILGPAVAGLLVSLVGPIKLLWIDSGTFFFFAVILFVLLRMPRLRRGSDQVQQSHPFLRNMTQGMAFTLHHPVLLSLLSLSFFWNVGLGLFTVALPFYCLSPLAVGSIGMGVLLSVNSFGVLLSTFFLGPLHPRYPGRTVCVLLLAQAVCFGIMAMVRPFWIVVVVYLIFGACDEVGAVYLTSLRQRIIPLSLQGRVQSFSGIVGQSGMPVGNGLAGLLLARIASQWVVACASLPLFFIGLLWLIAGPLRNVQDTQSRSVSDTVSGS